MRQGSYGRSWIVLAGILLTAALGTGKNHWFGTAVAPEAGKTAAGPPGYRAQDKHPCRTLPHLATLLDSRSAFG